MRDISSMFISYMFTSYIYNNSSDDNNNEDNNNYCNNSRRELLLLAVQRYIQDVNINYIITRKPILF